MCAVAHREDLPGRFHRHPPLKLLGRREATVAATRTLEGPACAGSAAVLFSRTFRVFSTPRKKRLDGHSKRENQKGSKPQQDSRECKGSRLTLRNGVWHANDVPCAKYSHALRKTFQTAAIRAQPIAKPPRWKIRQRLEERTWWPAYIGWRKARELELLLAECEAAEKLRQVEEASTKVDPVLNFSKVDPEKLTHASTFQKLTQVEKASTFRSLTLRERYLAKAVRA